MDLNKMLVSGTSLVPKGHTPRWEVDGERCEQITLLLIKTIGLMKSQMKYVIIALSIC